MRIACLATALGLCFSSAGAGAANIQWIPTDGFAENVNSGSLPFRGGSIDVSIAPAAGLFTQGTLSPTLFATPSARYENIDTEPYSSLDVRPDPAGPQLDWSVEFDFVDALLGPGDAFNVGQLFVDPDGTVVTELSIAMFAADDTTPFDLVLLDFESHARATANFDAPLLWDPATGLLTSDATGAGQNSRFAFLSPLAGEVGLIPVSASTTRSGDLVQFAFAVPEPSTATLLALGLLGLGARRR